MTHEQALTIPVNTELIIVGRRSGHSKTVGSTRVFKMYHIPTQRIYTNGSDECFYLDDVDIKNPIVLLSGKEQLLNKVNKLNAELSECQEKLDWMVETEQEEFDEFEFQLYKSLIILDNPETSKIDKCKLLKSLIKKK